MESRFKKVMKKVSDWVEHADPAATPRGATHPGTAPQAAETPERFVMKPGEVQIIRGGGARISRGPGDKRG